MKLIIDIDENLYTKFFDNGVDNYDDVIDMAKSIRKGMPLENITTKIKNLPKIYCDEIYYRAVKDVLEILGEMKGE